MRLPRTNNVTKSARIGARAGCYLSREVGPLDFNQYSKQWTNQVAQEPTFDADSWSSARCFLPVRVVTQPLEASMGARTSAADPVGAQAKRCAAGGRLRLQNSHLCLFSAGKGKLRLGAVFSCRYSRRGPRWVVGSNQALFPTHGRRREQAVPVSAVNCTSRACSALSGTLKRVCEASPAPPDKLAERCCRWGDWAERRLGRMRATRDRRRRAAADRAR